MNDKKFNRRDMIRVTAAGGAGLIAAGAGLPVFAQDAKPPELDLPVAAKGKLTVIHRTEYFEAAQTIFRDTVANFAKEKGVELDISTTNAEAFGDFLGKVTAAVKAGNAPDLAYTSNVSIDQMTLLDIVEDVTDVVEEAVKRFGPIMPGLGAENAGFRNGGWKSIPFISGTRGFFFRGDKLKEKGIDPATLTTWGAIRDAALAISDPANNFWGWGNTVNQSGDGFTLMYAMLQAFGAHFTDETGQIVTVDSPEMLEGLKWIAETYDRNGKYGPMLPPGVESWGDTNNNEAYLAGSTGFTGNAYSVYAAAKRDNPELFANTVLLRHPTANNGDNRDGGTVGGWLTIFKNSPNKDLAKELALYILDPSNFNKMSAIAGGLLMPAYANLWTDELIASDPNFAIIKDQVSVTEPFMGQSWPAKPNGLITAIRAQGVIEQMAANVISGRMSAEDAVKDAHQKVVDIFEEGGAPQP